MDINMTECNCCEIPLNSMPLVGEADYGCAVNPMIHCDRRADFHVMIYLIQGGMEIIEEGIPYQLEAGSLFFLKKGLHHWGVKPFLQGTSWYYVHFYADCPDEGMPMFSPHAFQGDLLPGRVYLTGKENQSFVRIPKILQLPSSDIIRLKLEQLVDMHNTGQMIRSSILLWDILNECLMLTDYGIGVWGDERIKAVHKYLTENYHRSFSAEELSHTIGFSYKYLGTLFKKSTGKTIKEYQLMLRLHEAENLLRSTEMTISEIAAATGFYDTFHFSRIFKQEKEISPLQFRKAYVPRI